MATDRSALEAYLKEAGFALISSSPSSSISRGMVLLEPERSETKEVRASEKSVVVTISTRARDRHGDVIDPEGVRLDRFRKNPVVLYSHDYGGLPVAKSLWERVLREGQDVELVAKPQFHLQTELSREVWALVKKGVLNAWSVGFVPETWEPIRQTTNRQGAKDAKDDHGRRGERLPNELNEPESRDVLGALGGRGFVVTKWDLLEYSCVPVPANFEALTHELKERRITAPALVKSLAPLGLEAPDLVPHDVRTSSRQPQTSASSVEPRSQRSQRTTEVKVGPSSVASRSPSVPSVADVQAAVGRAFEGAIQRARGEGFV